MRWTFEPGNLGLVRSDGKYLFTPREFDSQPWPPCPGCGGSITAEGVRVGSLNEPDRMLVGSWSCPTVGCNPADAIRAVNDEPSATNE